MTKDIAQATVQTFTMDAASVEGTDGRDKTYRMSMILSKTKESVAQTMGK